MNKSKYTNNEKAYALSVVARFNGSFTAAAKYLKDEGKLVVTGKTLQNWKNDISLADSHVEPIHNAVTIPKQLLAIADIDEIKAGAANGLGLVVERLIERLTDDKYTKRITNNELVNMGSFFATVNDLDKDKQQSGSGTTNIYQQIINQTYHAKGN